MGTIVDGLLDADVRGDAAAFQDSSLSDAGASGDAKLRDADVQDAAPDAAESPSDCTGKCWEDMFDAAPVGTLFTSYLETHWPVASFGAGVKEGRASVKDESGNRFVQVLLPKDKVGAPSGGTTWRRTFSDTMEATLEYKVRFEPGFEWTKGGKIPGLTGGNSPTGGGDATNGFSARYMWQTDGGLILYLYHSRMPSQYGHSFRLGTLKQGTWHMLRQRIRMNTPGETDGEIQVWVDGVLKFERSNMEWRLSGASWKINSLLFTAFHGGNNADYTPSRDNHVDFDDFRVVVE